MDRTEIYDVSLLIVLAVLVRVLLFKQAGVWGDWGFYVYNAQLLHEGQVPFVDFIARSPLFMHLYALVADSGNQAYMFRMFVVFWWLLTALPVYGLAREIRGHWAGLTTLTLYLFAPFAITYGFWGNTQSVAAFFLMSGLYILVRRESFLAYVSFGVLAALAFLARRSVVVIFAALVLYAAWKYRNNRATLTDALAEVTGASAAFSITLFAGYLWLARWDVERAIAFADIHAINLFISSGRGGFPLLDTPPNPAVESATTNGIPIIHDLCQRCGSWTVRTFAKTLVLITPVVGMLLYYGRDWVQRWLTARDAQYLAGVLGALGLYAIVIAIQHGYYVRSLAVISIALFAILVYRIEMPSRDVLYSQHMMLLLCVLFALMAGYLYRARLLHTYYFMDFWPAIAIVAGILYKHSLQQAKGALNVILALAIILSLINTSAAAYPITNVVLDGNDAAWFTVESVEEYGDDMDARTQPGEEVLAANPSYLALSHANMVKDNARLYYTLVSYEDSGPGRDIYEHLIPRLRNGTIRYVVHTGLVDEMLGFNETAMTAFEKNYCPVEDNGLYAKTGATLYRYSNESC